MNITMNSIHRSVTEKCINNKRISYSFYGSLLVLIKLPNKWLVFASFVCQSKVVVK